MARKRTRARTRRGDNPPTMEETKDHILSAGREILLAAQGTLRFCKGYVESSPGYKSHPHLVEFFQKAIAVADELGNSILKVAPVQQVAKGIAKSLFESMEEEMEKEDDIAGTEEKMKSTKKKERPKRIPKRKTSG